MADAGKHIYTTAALTITIPAETTLNFPIGTTINIIAGQATGTTLVAITTDTMYLSPGGTTGTRTIAAFGTARLVKVASGKWFISGTGLT